MAKSACSDSKVLAVCVRLSSANINAHMSLTTDSVSSSEKAFSTKTYIWPLKTSLWNSPSSLLDALVAATTHAQPLLSLYLSLTSPHHVQWSSLLAPLHDPQHNAQTSTDSTSSQCDEHCALCPHWQITAAEGVLFKQCASALATKMMLLLLVVVETINCCYSVHYCLDHPSLPL